MLIGGAILDAIRVLRNMWIASLGDQLLSTKCNDEAKYEASTMTTAHVDIINDDNVIMCT